ncbi:MAG: polynucleotide adenylyltransferase PcnB [Deltaproteobacteria bacterium]|nr:polynucleotide adenylyltransferase PcnB [Deltaproteobacteria bacterium]
MSASEAELPIVLSRAEHPVSRSDIDINAIKVLYRLHHGGYKSYMVGGAVRDLMLGRRPKDFDVSTSARPQQVRRLFRNSRIIGRRFRLAHVFFRDGIVEVSTFRRDPDPESQGNAQSELLITDDNVFGSPEEDAYRRDFTINALFYDISDFSVIDWVGGVEDLRGRKIRAIGDPEVRFQEDPVRMLRACELAGRLDFDIEEWAQAAIRSHRREVEKAAPARLTEEVCDILLSGSSESILRWMMRLGLLEVFLPEAYLVLSAGEHDAGEFESIPSVIDEMVGRGETLSDAVLFGAVLLPSVLLRRRDVEAIDQRPVHRSALRELTSEVLEPFVARFALSRVRTDQLHHAVWAFQRFGARWKSAGDRIRFSSHPGFDDALALLEVLVGATGEGRAKLDLWRKVQQQRPEKPAPRGPARPRRRRRRRRR